MDAAPAEPGSLSKPGMAALAALGLATWALSHSYLGLFHDAGLYTLQALVRLHPDSLSADAFLKYGSQDRFTLFSPIFAAAAGWLGTESAAAWLTLSFQIALLGAAWALARTLMPLSMTLLGIGLLLAVPGDYGPDRIFTCMESFLTPRMAAEALALGSLTAALRCAYGWSALLITASALLHPIMAMAGICALYWLYVGERRPAVAIWLALAGVSALALAALTMPPGPWGRFDADWLMLVKNRSPYLFLGYWGIDDLSRAAVTLGTLLAGMRIAPAPVRTLCKIALLTCVSGIALTFIGCDLLHLVAVTQLQPWRWLWLGTLASALVLPEILFYLLRMERAGRATGLLLLSAWIFGPNPYALAATAAALVSLAGARRLQPGEIRWVHAGALGMLAIAIAWRLATNLEFTDSHYLDLHIALWLRRTMSFAHDGSAPAAIFAIVWWVARTPSARPGSAAARRPSARIGLAISGLLACAGCAALAPHAWASWTVREYPPQRLEQFAGLRQHIPRGADVFWPESPVDTWLLLDRPSYISVIQTSGLVFSRPGAREFERRADALRAAIAPGAFLSWDTSGTGINLSLQQLVDACGTGEFGFLVTHADLGVAPLATAPAARGTLRLYRCGTAPGKEPV